jgi:hypothetical protein
VCKKGIVWEVGKGVVEGAVSIRGGCPRRKNKCNLANRMSKTLIAY